MAILFVRSGLTSRIPDLALNYNPTMRSGRQRELDFWSRVKRQRYLKMFEIYKTDFEMFGFDFESYFTDIGINEFKWVQADVEETTVVNKL